MFEIPFIAQRIFGKRKNSHEKAMGTATRGGGPTDVERHHPGRCMGEGGGGGGKNKGRDRCQGYSYLFTTVFFTGSSACPHVFFFSPGRCPKLKELIQYKYFGEH